MAAHDSCAFLGFADDEITSLNKHVETWSCNKIGGTGIDSLKPACTNCIRNMSLALQLLCPLYGVAESRVLYVFVCTSSQCQNATHCWRVFRSQVSNECGRKIQKDSGSGDRKWKCEPQDDWGESVDQWGQEADNVVMSIGWSNDNLLHCESTLAEDFCDKATITDHIISPPNHYEIVDAVMADDGNMVACVSANGMTRECRSVEASQPITELPKEYCDENIDASIQESYQRMQILLSHQSEAGGPCKDIEFKAFFIAVTRETDEAGADADVHVRTLLKDYEYTHGTVISATPSQGHCLEVYERSQVLHGDRLFHKFTACLAANPQQCLRYQWNGTPLLSSPLPDVMPVCGNCGGECAFELQLTPGLITSLVPKYEKSISIEFATVLVYTCKVSCSIEGRVFTEETTIVQPDPYHKLLK